MLSRNTYIPSKTAQAARVPSMLVPKKAAHVPSELVTEKAVHVPSELDEIGSCPPSPEDSFLFNRPDTEMDMDMDHMTISLEFRDEGSFFSKPGANTVTVPDFIPEERNGTAFTDAMAYLKAPKLACQIIKRKYHNCSESPDLQFVGRKVGEAVEQMSGTISNCVNQAMEGQDAVEMLNKGHDLVPSVSLPSMRQLSKAVDGFTDSVQGMFAKKPVKETDPTPEISVFDYVQEKEPHNAPLEFTYLMGISAQKALIKNKIMPEYLVTPGQHNLDIYGRLNTALTNVYINNPDDCRYRYIDEMRAFWKGIPERGFWRLYIDTNIPTIEADGSDTPTYLDTGFELPEHPDGASTNKYNPDTQAVEENTEEVDNHPSTVRVRS